MYFVIAFRFRWKGLHSYERKSIRRHLNRMKQCSGISTTACNPNMPFRSTGTEMLCRVIHSKRARRHTTRDAPQQCDKKMYRILENRNVVKWNEFQFGSATASTLKMPLHRFLPKSRTIHREGYRYTMDARRSTECESIHLYFGHTADSAHTHTHFIVSATLPRWATQETHAQPEGIHIEISATAKWRINCQQ